MLLVTVLLLSTVSAGFGSKLYSFFAEDSSGVQLSPVPGTGCWSLEGSAVLSTYPNMTIPQSLSGDFELTGNYQGFGLTSTTHYEDLFLYLMLADESKGYRFRTAPSNTDTPHTAVTLAPINLPSQWACWKGNGDANCAENMTRTLYASATDVPFRLVRAGNVVTWTVAGQSHSVTLDSAFVGVPLKLHLAGWNDRSKNSVSNLNLICGTNSSTPVVTCSDSDGGLNYSLRGTVVVSPQGNQAGTTGVDQCVDTLRLSERTCSSDGGIEESIYSCPNGCSNGACNVAQNNYYATLNKTNYLVGESVAVYTHLPKFMNCNQSVVYANGVEESIGSGGCFAEGVSFSRSFSGALSGAKYKVIAVDPINSSYVLILYTPAFNVVASPTSPPSKTIINYANYISLRTGDIINFGNAYVRALVLQVPTCVSPSCDSLVNRNVIRFFYLPSRADMYTELESGESRTFSHTDAPLTSLTLSDVRVTVDSINISLNGEQSNTLANDNGAVIHLTKPQVCQQLIDDLRHPDETFAGNDGTVYQLSWNNTYVSDDSVQYYASWNGDTLDDAGAHGYSHLSLNVLVYNDPQYDASDYVNPTYCSVREISGNKVYVCSYRDPTHVEDEVKDWESDYVYVSWTNKNVRVTATIGSGRTLTSAELDAKVRDVMLAFTAHLQNNRFVYSEQGERTFFDRQSLLYGAVQACPSTVTADIQYGSLACKLEPLVCPPHGYQTQVCERNGVEVSSNTLSCSPGICAGCMVARWWGARGGDNICLPYSTRLVTADVERATLRYSDMQESSEFSTVINDDYTGTITLNEDISDQVSYLKVNGEKITLTKGTSFTFNEGWEYAIEVADIYDNSVPYTFTIFVEDVIKSENLEDSKVIIRFSEEKQPMYCNYDGGLYRQKTRDSNGDWAQCQNNYECESNVCSSGECIEVQSLLDQGKGLKGFAIRLLCRFTNIFSAEGYNQCIAEAYGQ